ncbi:hypothetical protein B5M47_02675 [candidate division CPR3 bacterium 4484_211]|uniref:AB hydrolase-1 domain-containing protein n=1 Tax=candidate division CPR3 bacterium 4484_211 TaxID=1968527 RepID=A0A1W9NXM4_UNCC3|nr:MAG: hypothetical protein B5M47_02675 [candidate division CPR3 bacterium 4484_211]
MSKLSKFYDAPCGIPETSRPPEESRSERLKKLEEQGKYEELILEWRQELWEWLITRTGERKDLFRLVDVPYWVLGFDKFSLREVEGGGGVLELSFSLSSLLGQESYPPQDKEVAEQARRLVKNIDLQGSYHRLLNVQEHPQVIGEEAYAPFIRETDLNDVRWGIMICLPQIPEQIANLLEEGEPGARHCKKNNLNWETRGSLIEACKLLEIAKDAEIWINFLHGWKGDRYAWMIPELGDDYNLPLRSLKKIAASGQKAVALVGDWQDIRAERTDSYTAADYEKGVTLWQNYLGFLSNTKQVLVGHSFGGIAALRLANNISLFKLTAEKTKQEPPDVRVVAIDPADVSRSAQKEMYAVLCEALAAERQDAKGIKPYAPIARLWRAVTNKNAGEINQFLQRKFIIPFLLSHSPREALAYYTRVRNTWAEALVAAGLATQKEILAEGLPNLANIPVWLIMGKDDRLVDLNHITEIHEEFAPDGPISIYEGADHNPHYDERYVDEIVNIIALCAITTPEQFYQILDLRRELGTKTTLNAFKEEYERRFKEELPAPFLKIYHYDLLKEREKDQKTPTPNPSNRRQAPPLPFKLP